MSSNRSLGSLALCAALLPAATMAAEFQVQGLELIRGVPGDPFAPTATRVDLRVALDGERILGVNEASAIRLLRDDTGAVLIGPGAPGPDEAAIAAAAAEGFVMTSQVEGGIRFDTANVGENGSDVTVSIVGSAIPAPGAQTLELEGTLVIDVADEGERVVTLEGVDLDPDWGTDLEVDGKRIGCRLDSSEKTGDQPRQSQFYCYGPELRSLRIVARGSENVAIERADQRPNLAVQGELTGLTIDFVLPVAEAVEVPVDLSFGLGLAPR